MNEKFFDLNREKQDRMINAALQVFAENNYPHASTDTIVKKAGISKGLLFHYFGSKIDLYAFLFDYSVKYMIFEYDRVLRKDETNYFQIRKDLEKAKLNVLRNYPYMWQFIQSGQARKSPPVSPSTAVTSAAGSLQTPPSLPSSVLSAVTPLMTEISSKHFSCLNDEPKPCSFLQAALCFSLAAAAFPFRMAAAFF